MKSFSYLSALLAFLVLLPTQAGAVALNGGSLLTGGIPETGFDEVTTGTYNYDTATGLLANQTKIVFTYTVELAKNGLGNWEFKPYDGNGNNFAGTVESTPVSWVKDNIFTTTFSLINTTGAAITFEALLFSNKLATVTSSFHTESLSSVPLPAALPLFGLGLAGLAGAKRMKKRNARS